jgi:hypothetical protein
MRIKVNNMKTKQLLGKEVRPGGFKKGYHAMPHYMLAEARKEICDRCYWTEGNFRQKLNGKYPFRVYEIGQIENYFKSHNINAWTGETLNVEYKYTGS